MAGRTWRMRRAQMLAAILLLARGATAHADDGGDTVMKARRLFVTGAEQVKREEWADALSAFEQSAALRPHAVTTYNLGVCERALGRYTRARANFEHALAESAATGGQLPQEFAADARGFADQI